MNCASVPCSESEATTRSSRNPTFNNKKYIQPAVGCKVLKHPTFSGVEYPPTPGYDAKGIFHQEPWKAVIGRCLEDSGQVWKVVPIRDEHLKAYQYLKQDFPNNQLIKKNLSQESESLQDVVTGLFPPQLNSCESQGGEGKAGARLKLNNFVVVSVNIVIILWVVIRSGAELALA